VTRWLWTAPDGSTTDLSAWSTGTYVLADGTAGHFAPGYEFTAQGFAGVDGQTLQQVTARPAEPVLGVDMVAADDAELRARVRALAHALRPRAGQGTLRAVADDGTQRTLPCYYREGLEKGVHTAGRFRVALQFWSSSPWWRGTPFTWGYGLAPARPFFPIPPVTLSATTIEGTATVDLSDTDAPSFPRWTITGPGSQLTLRNTWQRLDDAGRLTTLTAELVLNAPIGDGQLVAIDTRPGHQSVRRATRDPAGTLVLGESLFGSLASDPAMWPLVDGVNTVSALLTNAGPASRIDLEADRLYSGAL
jgi:hypothetical protein